MREKVLYAVMFLILIVLGISGLVYGKTFYGDEFGLQIFNGEGARVVGLFYLVIAIVVLDMSLAGPIKRKKKGKP